MLKEISSFSAAVTRSGLARCFSIGANARRGSLGTEKLSVCLTIRVRKHRFFGGLFGALYYGLLRRQHALERAYHVAQMLTGGTQQGLATVATL